jgi:phage shock protein A
MSVIGRLLDVITARTNILLERLEDPEQMLLQVTREMEEALAQARRHGAMAIAAEHRLKRELEECRRQLERARTQAAQALVHQRDDLARRALSLQIDMEERLAKVEANHAEAVCVSTDVKRSLQVMAERLDAVRQRARLLVGRRAMTRVRLDVERWRTDGGASYAGCMSRFELWQQRLEDSDALWRGEIATLVQDEDVEAEIRSLEKSRRIEERLAQMKSDTSPGERLA